MSEETPPTYTTSVFNQSNFNQYSSIDTDYLNANYVKYPVAQTGTITIANLATTNDVTINSLTVGRGGGAVSSCVALGASTLGSNTTGIENTALGSGALFTATTAGQNTAVGHEALYSNTNGTLTAVGFHAARNSTGANNLAIGYRALRGTAGTNTGTLNTAIGSDALLSVTSGSNNVALGYQAGQAGTALTTGSNNTFIGYQAQASGVYSNSVALGSGAIINRSNDIVLGTNAETVRYNKVAPLYTSVPTFATTDIGYFYSGTGSINFGTSAGNNVFSVTPVVGLYLVCFNISAIPNNTVAQVTSFSIKYGGTVQNISTIVFTANSNSTTQTPISLQAPISANGSTAITVEYICTGAGGGTQGTYYYSILRIA